MLKVCQTPLSKYTVFCLTTASVAFVVSGSAPRRRPPVAGAGAHRRPLVGHRPHDVPLRRRVSHLDIHSIAQNDPNKERPECCSVLLVLKLSCVQLWPLFQCLFLRGASDTDGQISTTSLPGENPPVEGHDLPVEGHDVLAAAAEEVVIVILCKQEVHKVVSSPML